jgi:hypothetical protein
MLDGGLKSGHAVPTRLGPLRGPAAATSTKAAGGRFRSAGTFGTEDRALAVAEEAERHVAEVAIGAAGT